MTCFNDWLLFNACSFSHLMWSKNTLRWYMHAYGIWYLPVNFANVTGFHACMKQKNFVNHWWFKALKATLMACSRETKKLACVFHQTGIWPLFLKQLFAKRKNKEKIKFLCLGRFANVVNYIALSEGFAAAQ